MSAQGSFVFCGDVLDVLAEIEDEYFDAVFCDPPYGLSFMGRRWDHGVPSKEVWEEVKRVVKPGGHIMAFGGTRTYHRLAVAIEDAGWEIRDSCMWLYGSGFPKAHDISKALDKVSGELGRKLKFTKWMRSTGLSESEINKITDTCMGSHYLTDKSQPAIPTPEIWETLRPHCGEVPPEIDRLVGRVEAEREVVGQKKSGIANPEDNNRHTVGGSSAVAVDITAPATRAARRFDGYKTALKPAYEPIVVAMKPKSGTYADNALEYGVSGLNIDGGRIGDMLLPSAERGVSKIGTFEGADGNTTPVREGRFPANLILDEAAAEALDDQAGDEKSRFFYTAKASRAEREAGLDGMKKQKTGAMQANLVDGQRLAGDGTPIKTPKRANTHPCVKPIDLCRYFTKLLLPPDRTDGEPRKILVPFSGSGSEMIGAMLAGWDCVVGIEMNEEYCEIARKRLAHWRDEKDTGGGRFCPTPSDKCEGVSDEHIEEINRPLRGEQLELEGMEG